MTEADARLGETVGGKYRVTRFLARGGMGVVYEAQHVLVGRRFAIKFLRPELSQKRESLARFQREAEAAGALENENVTAVLDFGIAHDGAAYLVMECLVGENLEQLLAREGPLPLARASELVLQASRGVQAAHAAGIVHRDLKPQNLFACRREDGTELVKVLDFGVAKLGADEGADSATQTGSVLGTPAYMAPEQARGDKHIDHRADVYALGAVLYELVSGKRPHPGDSPNAILHHIATQPAVPLAAVQPELPAGVLQLVARALAAEPERRFPSADAFGHALAPFARRTVWPAPPLELPLRPLVEVSASRPRFTWALLPVAAALVLFLLARASPAPVSLPEDAPAHVASAMPMAPAASDPLPRAPAPSPLPAASAVTPVPVAASAASDAGQHTGSPSARPRRQSPKPPAVGIPEPPGTVMFDTHNPYH